MNSRPVGVVGAGIMGCGLAQNLAETGHQVVLIDLTEEILARARAEIVTNARLERLLRRTPTSAADVLQHITLSVDYGALATTDLVIENVPEKWEIKQAVYRQLDVVCPADCIFIANSSCIPIERIAAVTQRSTHVIGVHFMNPVALKQTVEVIPTRATSAATLERVQALLTRLGKVGITVKDVPGFASNRVLMPMINEAACLLQDEVASAQDIDQIFTSCFGHKMGPLETGDLIGLDTVVYSLEVLQQAFGDDKYRPCALLRELVAAGRFGRKSGQGFHTYPEKP